MIIAQVFRAKTGAVYQVIILISEQVRESIHTTLASDTTPILEAFISKTEFKHA